MRRNRHSLTLTTFTHAFLLSQVAHLEQYAYIVVLPVATMTAALATMTAALMPREAESAVDDGDDNSSLDCLAEWFIDKQYTLRCYSFTPALPITSSPLHSLSALPVPLSSSSLNIPAYSLYQATTAYDLTGQILWPGTDILSCFLLSPLSSSLLPCSPSSCLCLELGAGIGLLSLLLLHRFHPPQLIATDHNSTVLSLLSRNLALQSASSSSTAVSVLPLEWSAASVSASLPLLSSSSLPVLIVASELVYSVDAVQDLIACIAAVLRQSSRGGIAVLSWLTRWRTVDSALYAAIDSQSMRSREVQLDSFMQLQSLSPQLRADGHLLLLSVEK